MSSLKDLASLIMIPSLVKDGRLDTVKPLGNEIIHPDATGNNDGTDGSTPSEGNFTFSRGSNLAATRVDVNGLIEKGRENLSKYSQTGASWGSSSVSIDSTNAVDFFGGTNAVTYTSNGGGAAYVFSDNTISITSGNVYTGSIYVKNVDADYVQLTFGTGAFGSAQYRNFDLTNGTLGGGLGIDATIQNVGGGWYRISLTALSTASSASAIVIVVAPSASASRLQAATSGKTLTAFASQLEQGLVATDYIETGASTAQAGILEDLPRLDYSGGASCPALLLEPQRTNKIAQSEYQISLWYPSATWTIEQNTSDLTSPEGKYNAVKLIETSANSYHSGYYNATIENSYTGTYTISAYAKYNGRLFVLNPYNTGIGRTYFNLQTGEVAQLGTNVTAGIEDTGDGWYRCYVTGTYSSSNVTFEHMLASAVGTLIYQGDGTSGAYIYGCQAEAGSYPTSYIPTYGSAVTRSGDSCLATSVSDLIGQEQGTMFVEAKTNFDFQGGRLLLIGQTNNFIELVLRTTGKINAFAWNGTAQADFNSSSTYSTGDTLKIALAYKENDYVLYINGVQEGSDTSGVIPNAMAQIIINNYTSPNYSSANAYKQATLFKTRLTNAELAALTTI